MRHVLSVLVLNQPGVLSRVAGMFSRRGYNIESLSVGKTEDEEISRMTIVTYADDETLKQIISQLSKIISVITIKELTDDIAVYRELVMIKVKADFIVRAQIVEISNIFRSHIIDVSNQALIIEVTGDSNKIQAIIEMLEPYGILEVVRTGLVALERGNTELKDFTE